MTTPRSVLYVPGNRPDLLVRAGSRGADALIIDLEDAVALNAKDEACRTTHDFLSRQADTRTYHGQLWVRVNPGRRGLQDIATVCSPILTGFVLAKVEDVHGVQAAAGAAATAEQTLGMAAGSLLLSPLLESAAAVLDARLIAGASPRVRQLQVGEADLAADTGVTLGDDELELLPARSAVIMASAAAGIDPPLAAVSTDFTDLTRFRDSTEVFRRLGYRGRACIHPAQCAVANDVFTPDAADLARARQLITRHDAAQADTVFTDEEGRMVDAAVIRHARQLVAWSERIAAGPTRRNPE